MINEEEDHKSNHGDPIGSEVRIINQEEDKSNSSESNTEESHHFTGEERQIVIYQSQHIQEELKERMSTFIEEQEDIQPLPPFPYLPNEELFVEGGGRIAKGTGLLTLNKVKVGTPYMTTEILNSIKKFLKRNNYDAFLV